MNSMEVPNEPHNYIYAKHAQPRDFPYKELKGLIFLVSSKKLCLKSKIDVFYSDTVGFFNWTWTYRHDSDMVTPHGWFHPIKMNPLILDWSKVLGGGIWRKYRKSKLNETEMRENKKLWNMSNKQYKVAWIASHCYTR